MARFKCTNKECHCSRENTVLIVSKISFKWDINLQKLIIKDCPKCKYCCKEMELEKEETNGKIECNFMKFNSLSSNQKKSMMKKRYQEHSKNEVKDKVHEVRKSILGENYKLIPKGQ